MDTAPLETLPLSRFLTDFTPRLVADEAVEILTASQSQSGLSEPSGAEFTDEAAEFDRVEFDRIVEVERVRREGFEEGHAQGLTQGTEQADALFEAEKQRLLRQHEDDLVQARNTIMDEIAQQALSQLQQGFVDLEAVMSQQMTIILAPLVKAYLSDKAVESFAQKLADQALSGSDISIEIKGPSAYLEALERHRELLPEVAVLMEADQPELSFSMNEQVLQTRLGVLLEELDMVIR